MVPPKSIHFPLRKKREENRGRREEGKRGGDKSKMEGKDRMGVCVDMHGEYIILLRSSTVTRCNVTVSGDASMAES